MRVEDKPSGEVRPIAPAPSGRGAVQCPRDRAVRVTFDTNAARGALINEADLAEALKSGQVAGAALDVYADEPPAEDNPLVGLPNVIDTPHLAASTEEAAATVESRRERGTR